MSDKIEKTSPSKGAEIDTAIAAVERLYQSVTGRAAPERTNGAYAAIPPEVDVGRHVEAQMDRLLAALGASGATGDALPRWAPFCTVVNRGAEIIVRADLPGVAQQDLKVLLQPGSLEISGVRQSSSEGFSAPLNEVRSGSFRRVLPLPQTTAIDKAEAKLAQGVLEVRLPLGAATAITRSLPVQ